MTRDILPNLLATFTGMRYRPEIIWSSESWVHNIFRTYEMIFGRKYGIRIEASTSVYKDPEGKMVIERAFYTFESILAHVESMIRGAVPLFVPVRVFRTQLATVGGLKMPEGFLFAIAYDATTDGGFVATSNQISYSHTCTGSDGFFVHAGKVYSPSSSGISGVTHNGTAQTYAGDVDTTTGAGGRSYLHGKYGPTTGAQTVVLSGGSNNLVAMCASYTGCANAALTAVATNTAASGTSLTITTTVGSASSWLVASQVNQIGTASAGAGTVVRTTNVAATAIGDSNGAPGTGSQSLIFTIASSGESAGVIAEMTAPSTTAVKTYKGLATASVKTVKGLAIASRKTKKGLA